MAIKKVTLAVLVAATLSETGFMYATEAQVKELVKHGYADVNPDMKDASGAFAVRATEAGITAHNNAQVKADGAGSDDEGVAQTSFKIVNKELPAGTRRGRQPGACKYPFDDLEVGQSFFVGDKVSGMDDAYKGMASSVTGANKRWSEEIKDAEPVKNRKGNLVQPTKQLREFRQSRVQDGADWGFAGISGTVIGRVS